MANEKGFSPVEAEHALIDLESLLTAAHLAAGAARTANDLDAARNYAAASEAVMAACLVEAEKVRTAIYTREG